MAEDVICLLDTLGWTGERELTVVGISLGGMIAQGRPVHDFYVKCTE
jgi:pimeloyl-ACP methyl ester carboxylesterase